MDFAYSAFGLVFRSNVPFPGVPPAETHDPGRNSSQELQFYLDAIPYPDAVTHPREKKLVYTSSYADDRGKPALHIWDSEDEAFLRLAYSDGTQFWIDRERRRVFSTWPDGLSLENTLSYLLGPVFGLLLRLRGVTCLHASAVAFGEACAIFVGSGGAGKSTTAAAFAKRGHAVLSDDIVALFPMTAEKVLATSPETWPETGEQGSSITPISGFVVQPAYPHLCLWPDAAKLVYGSAENLPLLAPDWDKRKLELGSLGTRFESRPLPIAAIYLFTDRGPDPAPSIAPAQGEAALLSLVANTYANNLLDRDLRAKEFAVLDRLVAGVPLRQLTPHVDANRLDAMCALVEGDLAALSKAV